MTDKSNHDDIEERAEDRLSHVEFDTELGKKMARDARRVSDGELSRAAFEEKYMDDVQAEFGVDLAADPHSEAEPSPGVPPTESKASRRDMLKAAGTLAAGGVMAGAGSSFAGDYVSSTGTASAQSDSGTQMGMVIDTESCIKCLSCVQGCKEENHTPEGHFWQEVFRYRIDDKEYGSAPDTEAGCDSVPRPCMHCDDAPCVEVCPNNSRFKSENGRVLCDYDTCLGCAYCEIACPYHVNSFVHEGPPEYLADPEASENYSPENKYQPIGDEYQEAGEKFQGKKRDDEGRWVAGTPPHGSCSKCTFCSHRENDDEADGTTTACEDVCPVDAIQFGDLNDPESDPSQYLQEKFGGDEDTESDAKELREKYVEDTFQLRENASDPNVIYVGDDPSDKEVTEVDGPRTPEDLGLEKQNPTLH